MSRIGRSGIVRFATAADAIRSWMQVGDERFDSDDIRRLYESSDYPRRRRKRQLS